MRAGPLGRQAFWSIEFHPDLEHDNAVRITDGIHTIRNGGRVMVVSDRAPCGLFLCSGILSSNRLSLMHSWFFLNKQSVGPH